MKAPDDKVFRWSNFNGANKPVTGGVIQTVSFTGNDLPSSGVIAYHIVTTAAANSLTNITRLRLKSDGTTIYDVATAPFRRWFERFTQANTVPGLTLQSFTIPVNFCDIIDDDLADVCQFPPGTVPTLEIVFSAASAAGNVFCGWTQSNQDCHFTPMLLGNATNIGINQNASQFPITVPGDAQIRAVIHDTTGIGTFRIELNQFWYHQQIGALYLGVATGDMTIEGDRWEDPATVTTQTARRIPMITPQAGISRLLLDTGATYPATAELTLWMARQVA